MTVLVLVGLPGSGKSTWAAAQPITVLSSDAIRQLLADDVNNQHIHKEVFRTLRFLLRRRLELGAAATIIDATSLLPAHRKPWIKLAHSLGALAEAVYFDTPLEECLRRNAARSRVVPPEVITSLAAKLCPPTLAEGFTTIHRIPFPPTNSYPGEALSAALLP